MQAPRRSWPQNRRCQDIVLKCCAIAGSAPGWLAEHSCRTAPGRVPTRWLHRSSDFPATQGLTLSIVRVDAVARRNAFSSAEIRDFHLVPDRTEVLRRANLLWAIPAASAL